jgi:hypothetical protein
MRILRDRDEAIGVACAMLDEGIEVTGIGPLLDTSQQKIDQASLHEICRRRRRVCHPQLQRPLRNVMNCNRRQFE